MMNPNWVGVSITQLTAAQVYELIREATYEGMKQAAKEAASFKADSIAKLLHG